MRLQKCNGTLQDMFIERGFTVKESKECGAGGSMVRYSFLWQGGHAGVNKKPLFYGKPHI